MKKTAFKIWATLPRRLSMVAMIVALTGASGASCFPQSIQDVVVTRRENSDETVKRRGTIAEWKGYSLTISSNGRDRDIENELIVKVQTNWQPDYRAGLEQLESGDVTGAIKLFRSALKAEQRPWAQRIIRADLVRSYQATDNHLGAIQQFLAITQEDPQTRFFYLCPLPWIPSNVALTRQARQWMGSSDPVQQLIGASWLVTSADREAAIKVLEELSRDIDANIKYTAIAQLWRIRRMDVNARQIEVWKKLIFSMPHSIRAGPWFVLSDAQSRAEQIDEATINLMRIPILYPDQIGLSAAALYRAGHLMHNTGRVNEAQMIWNELRKEHPHSEWAQQAPAANAPTDSSR